MKKLSILLLCVVAMVATSCKSSSDKKSSKTKAGVEAYAYENAIPKDAYLVMSMNANSIVKKSGLYENQTFKNQMLGMVRMVASDATYNILNDIANNLNNSGVDCSAPMYVAMNGVNYDSYVFTAKMGDKAKFEALLNAFKSDGLLEGVKSGDADGYKYLELDNAVVMGYNDAALVVAPRTKLAAAFSRSYKNSALSTSAFEKMKEGSVDINCLMNFGPLMDATEKQMGAEQAQQMKEAMATMGVESFDGIYVYTNVDFINGAIAIYGGLYSENEAMNAYQQKAMATVMPLSGRFNKYSAKSINAMLSYGFNGSKMVSYLKTALVSLVGMPEESVDILERVLSPVEGDVSVVYSEGKNFNIFVDAVSNDGANQIVASIEEQMGDQSEELNLKVDGDIVTASSNIYESVIITDAKNPSVNDIDFKTSITNDMFMFGFVTEECISELIYPSVGDNYQVMAALDMIDKVEFSADKDCRGVFYITLDNKRDNALKSITDYFLSNL